MASPIYLSHQCDIMLTCTDLKRFEMYSVKIAAQNLQGDGPASEAVSVKTWEDGRFAE